MNKATEYHRINIVKLLISKGADINFKDLYGYTPLRLAIEKGYKDISELLISNGAMK